MIAEYYLNQTDFFNFGLVSSILQVKLSWFDWNSEPCDRIEKEFLRLGGGFFEPIQVFPAYFFMLVSMMDWSYDIFNLK